MQASGGEALASVEQQTFTCMGAKISWRRWGNGPPMLWLRSEDSFAGDAAFLARLGESHEVIAADHPGFGASDMPKWFKGMGDIAYFYLDFLEHIGLEGAHVAGASVGAWIGAEIAVRDRARLASLSLIAPYGVRQPGETFGDTFLWTPETNVRNRFADQQLAGRFLQGETSEEDTRLALKNRYATARIGWSPRFHNPELQRWLHRIKVPVLLLWGEDDKLAPVSMAQAWTGGLPDARLETIGNCGHLPHIERPDETLAAITAFTKETHS